MTAKDPRAAKIAALNDAFRQNRGGSGRQVMTAGVSAEGPEFVTKALAAIATFDAFTADNDPYGPRTNIRVTRGHSFGVAMHMNLRASHACAPFRSLIGSYWW